MPLESDVKLEYTTHGEPWLWVVLGTRVNMHFTLVYLRAECKAQIDKYPGAVFKGFSNATEAHEFAFSSKSSHARSTYGGPSHSNNHVSHTQQRSGCQERGSNNRHGGIKSAIYNEYSVVS